MAHYNGERSPYPCCGSGSGRQPTITGEQAPPYFVHTGNRARYWRQSKDVKTPRLETWLKKGLAANAHVGVARQTVSLNPSTAGVRHL